MTPPRRWSFSLRMMSAISIVLAPQAPAVDNIVDRLIDATIDSIVERAVVVFP